MSERLTKRTKNGGVQFSNGEYWNTVYPQNEHCLTDIHRMAIKLCDLEDKIEQGKILELPCAAGQTVYLIAVKRPCFACWGCSDWCHKDCQYTNKDDLAVKEATVEKIEIEKNWVRIKCYVKETNSTINSHDDWRNLSDFGKTVFLDRAAAEAKLREMEGDNNE